MSLKEKLAAGKAKQPLGITPMEWARFQQQVDWLDQWQCKERLTDSDRQRFMDIIRFVRTKLP